MPEDQLWLCQTIICGFTPVNQRWLHWCTRWQMGLVGCRNALPVPTSPYFCWRGKKKMKERQTFRLSSIPRETKISCFCWAKSWQQNLRIPSIPRENLMQHPYADDNPYYTQPPQFFPYFPQFSQLRFNLKLNQKYHFVLLSPKAFVKTVKSVHF